MYVCSIALFLLHVGLVMQVMCMGLAVGNVGMSEADILTNVTLAVNFLVSLLKKNWQNVKRLYLKSTMGPAHRIFGF